MGRKPNALVHEFFERGAKLPDNSNRYEHTCKRCGEHFPKGRSDSLMNHLLKRCPAVTQEDRQVVFMFMQSGGDSRPFEASSNSCSHPPVNHNFGLGDTDDRTANVPNGNNIPDATQSLPLLLQRDQSALDTLAEVSRQYGSQHMSVGGRQDVSTDDAQRAMLEQTLFSELQKAGVSKGPPMSNETAGLYLYPIENDAPLANAEALTSSPLVRAATAANLQLEQSHAKRQVQGGALDPRLNDHQQQTLQQTTVQSNSFQSAAPDLTGFTWNPTTISGRNVTFGSLSAPSNEPTPGFGLLQSASKAKSRGRFSDDRRKEVQEIRKRGACIRCRMLKKPCSEGTPCNTCKNIEVARLWKGSCVRTRIAEECALWSTPLFHSRSKLSVQAAIQGLDNLRLHGRVEVRLLANTDICMSYAAKQYGENLGAEAIDPSLHDGMFAPEEDVSKILVLDEGEGVSDKISNYCNTDTVLDALVEAEPNYFVKATLRHARLLAETEMTGSAPLMAQDPLAARSGYNMPNLLLKNVIELWIETVILSTSEEIDLSMRYGASSLPTRQPEAVQWPANDDMPAAIKPISPDSPSHRLIKVQLLAATESRCSRLSKAVMNELELRLLQRRQVSGFATFISAVILLSCVERITGFYRSLDPAQHALSPSSQPLAQGTAAEAIPPGWPLDSPPSALWPQGSHFANLLIMLLRMRALPPRVMKTTDGKLKVLQENDLPVKLNWLPTIMQESEAEQTRLAAAWLNPLELSVDELTEKRDNTLGATLPLIEEGSVRSSRPGNAWDMLFIARVLLPEKI